MGARTRSAGAGGAASADRGLSPRDVSTHVRGLLRALEEGARPGRKTTATQLRRLAAALEEEAVRREGAGRSRAEVNGMRPMAVWTATIGDLDGFRLVGDPDVVVRVTVQRVA